MSSSPMPRAIGGSSVGGLGSPSAVSVACAAQVPGRPRAAVGVQTRRAAPRRLRADIGAPAAAGWRRTHSSRRPIRRTPRARGHRLRHHGDPQPASALLRALRTHQRTHPRTPAHSPVESAAHRSSRYDAAAGAVRHVRAARPAGDVTGADDRHRLPAGAARAAAKADQEAVHKDPGPTRGAARHGGLLGRRDAR